MGIFIMKEIQLNHGIIALVDDEDFDRVNQFKWYGYKNGRTTYCIRNIRINGKRSSQSLHHFILNIQNAKLNKIEVDHISGNGLDNQKHNLRVCSHSENMMNQRSKKNGSSKFVGVSWNKRDNNFQSEIRYNGIRYYLGTYKSEIDAARAHDNKAKELFGEFANLNFK